MECGHGVRSQSPADPGPVMLHDEYPEFGGDVLSPSSRGGASVAININLPKPAASAGAEVVMAAQDVFWGARYGRVRDPFGHVWAFNAPLRENAA
jgi:PhnB protein